MNAAAPTLAALREAVARIDRSRPSDLARESGEVRLGHPPADACLGGGLRRDALHEVFPAAAGDEAAATGFALALARIAGGGRPLVWVRQDMAGREVGEPYAPGLVEIGLDPARLVIVHAADAVAALRCAADALHCEGLGAVLLEPWGQPRSLDLTASRRLSLAAGAGVTAIALRPAGRPCPSAADTRWRIAAAPTSSQWSAPVFAAELLRNRRGPAGRWIMEWNRDEARLADARPDAGRPPAHPVAAPAEPSRRSVAEEGRLFRRTA